MITKAYPTAVPVPDGYRMLAEGEIIKENDQHWNGTSFTDVPKVMSFVGQYDSSKHGCVIRASLDHVLIGQEGKQTYPPVHDPTKCYHCGGLLVSLKGTAYSYPDLIIEGKKALFCLPHNGKDCKQTWLDYRQSQTAKDEQRADIIKPDYYQTESVYEPFKIIRHFNLNFFEGNVLKYLLRAGKKNSATRLEDLRKAYTYLASEIEQTKKEGKAE